MQIAHSDGLALFSQGGADGALVLSSLDVIGLALKLAST